MSTYPETPETLKPEVPGGTDPLVVALREVVATCKAGVIERRETGKPTWNVLDYLKAVAGNALAEYEAGK